MNINRVIVCVLLGFAGSNNGWSAEPSADKLRMELRREVEHIESTIAESSEKAQALCEQGFSECIDKVTLGKPIKYYELKVGELVLKGDLPSGSSIEMKGETRLSKGVKFRMVRMAGKAMMMYVEENELLGAIQSSDCLDQYLAVCASKNGGK